MSTIKSSYTLITYENPKSPISESYRTLRTNIEFSTIGEVRKMIAVVSAKPSEGKTLTVSNLAVAYAQEGKRVVLLDGDLRKPSVHRAFQLSNQFGLSQYLTHQVQLDECLQKTMLDGLFVMPAGAVPPNPAEMLSSNRMMALIDELKTGFDVVLIDTPPVLAVTDSQIISSYADGVILVIREGNTKRALVKKTKEQLQRVNAKILGVVLNDKQVGKNKDYYNYY